jgi:endonuclease/exonuclease/phosphatase family metal-dependent hydrolase
MRITESVLVVLLLALTSCVPAPEPARIRIATFNISMGLSSEGEMAARLASGTDPGLARIAEVLQRVRPDIVLLTEFDYSPGAAALLSDNYLLRSWAGQPPLRYDYFFDAPVNTGVDSGLDLNDNGRLGDPHDAWGFGHFPGQYGMAAWSRFPILAMRTRTFRNFAWRDMPGALRPTRANGEDYYPDETWEKLRLSSKSHWDLGIDVGGTTLHLLASHPTPPVFDGPEDRNGRRNYDEIRLLADYITPGAGDYLVDDDGVAGGLPPNARFVIAGDLNADPFDGDSINQAIMQLLGHPGIDASCLPRSRGGAEATANQSGQNLNHRGDPALDTADFNDDSTGNLRLDYVLPSRGLKVIGCGVFWPASDEPGHELAGASDHHLVWVDIEWPALVPGGR